MPDEAETLRIAAAAEERQHCIARVLTYAALRAQAAVDLDRAANGTGDDVPSEGAAERARMQADVARDIARFLAEPDLGRIN